MDGSSTGNNIGVVHFSWWRMMLKSHLILIVGLCIIALSACEKPESGHSPPYSMTGTVRGDGFVLQSAIIDSALVKLFQGDSLVSTVTADQTGNFRIDELQSGTYSLLLSKTLPYDNQVFDSILVSVDQDDLELGDIRLANVKKDYFPLEVGNTWTYEQYNENSPGPGGNIYYTWSILTLEILSKSSNLDTATYLYQNTTDQYLHKRAYSNGEIFFIDDQRYMSVDSAYFSESEGRVTGFFSGFHAYENKESLLTQERATYLNNHQFSDDTLSAFSLRSQETLEDESYITLVENIGPAGSLRSFGMASWSISSRTLIAWILN